MPLSRWSIVGLCFILLIAAAMRVVHLADFSYEMDELWSMEMAVGNGSVHDHFEPSVIHTDQPDVITLTGAPHWWHIWTHMNGVTAPPLYVVVLRWWMDLFGQSPAATRSLSVVFSMLGIVVLFDICRLLHGPRVALFAAAIIALAGLDIDIAQLARNYAMLTFLILCCADAVVRIEKLGLSRLRLLEIALSIAAMAMTHYLSASAAAAIFIYALLRLRKPARLPTLGAFFAGALLAAVLWGPGYIQQRHSLGPADPTYLIDPRVEGHFYRTMARAMNVPLLFLLGMRTIDTLPLIYGRLFDIPVCIAPLFRLRRRGDLLLWVLLLFVTLGSLVLTDLSRGWLLLTFFRYCTLGGPAVYALVATFDMPNRPVLRRWFPAASLAMLALLAVQRINPGLTEWQDIQDYANLVDTQARPDDLLVFYSTDPLSSAGVNFMQLKYYAPQTQRPWMILNQPADSSVLQKLAGRNSLWLIAPAESESKASDILPGWQVVQVLRTREPVVMQMVPMH